MSHLSTGFSLAKITLVKRASLAIFLLCSVVAVAQDAPVAPAGTSVATQATPAAATSSEELRKQSQNPIANLISVPVQDNWNFAIGPDNRVQNVINIQPVIPFSVSKDWNLITRWITPIVYQPISAPVPPGSPVTGVYGLGDVNPSFLLSPKKGKVIWGIGPTFVFPTATIQPTSGRIAQPRALNRRASPTPAFYDRVSYQ